MAVSGGCSGSRLYAAEPFYRPPTGWWRGHSNRMVQCWPKDMSPLIPSANTQTGGQVVITVALGLQRWPQDANDFRCGSP